MDPRRDGDEAGARADASGRGAAERAVAETPDAVAGLALVRERLSRRTRAEQDAFWEAVGRCFSGGAPPIAGG